MKTWNGRLPEMPDILIIGGGFAGLALAYYLSKDGASVTLLEGGSLGGGASAAPAGRAQIIDSETEEYLDLVIRGVARLETLGEELGVDLEWTLPGHLTLISNDEEWRHFESLVRRLQRHAVPAEMLDIQSLRAAEPYLQAEGFLGAAYSHEGHLNPFKFTAGYAQAARRAGAEIIHHARVIGFEQCDGLITAVLTEKERFSGRVVLMAAGPWMGELAEMAGTSFPMKSTHAEAIVSEKLPRLLHHHIGMTGFYKVVHGAERSVTLGIAQHPNGTLFVSNAVQKMETLDLTSTYWGMPALCRAVRTYFPRLAGARIMRTWAAPSPFTPDYLPAIGWMPGFDNLYVAAGFHLAIPTIPLLAEEAAKSILEFEERPMLAPYNPGRFYPAELPEG
ncbi:MAG: FAD-binding oxidoreductase [Anaerolineaceae bacterium]|nr:FAD-binding oxidoreductase [Anaerolineaceae bacterium]